MKYVPSRVACQILGLCPDTLRKYADNGLIDYIRNAANQRRYDTDSFIKGKLPAAIVCYCRVSTSKDKEGLAKQVVKMQENFPQAEVIQDIGSGLDYNRKGLNTILERLAQGEKLTIVVADKTDLARFGSELIEYFVRHNGGELLVLNRAEHDNRELTNDLCIILKGFAAKCPGFRRYLDQIKKDKALPH